jgi:SAM-dependent methyltransferase
LERGQHWEDVYRKKRSNEVSWYAPSLARSLELVFRVTDPRSGVIDVGGGASTLVDDLLRAGYRDVTVLDISGTALAVTEERLGPAAETVHWIVADALTAELPPARFDLWHDRAVFHFLTETTDRAAYAARARSSVKPGAHLLMATFAPEGPNRCSGLEVVRYDGASLARELPGFNLLEESREWHTTPAGSRQQFTYALLQRAP